VNAVIITIETSILSSFPEFDLVVVVLAAAAAEVAVPEVF